MVAFTRARVRSRDSPKHDLPVRHLTTRADGDPAISATAIIVIALASLIVLIGLAGFLMIRLRRRSPGKGNYKRTAGDEGRSRSRTTSSFARTQSQGANEAVTQTNVDRTLSIRSIMTLPAYRTRPSESEQVLGREGERDGVDVIVELNTEAYEEALREEEMETLYQIRLARRQQLAEREARREERAAARAAGDNVALAEIRARQASVAREDRDSTLTELRQARDQINQRRQRAVSSVSYHELGVARADGTRLRANSSESERMGLLSDAASIGGGSIMPRHSRERSGSSAMSFDSNTEVPSPGHQRSGLNTPRLSLVVTSETIDETDLGEVGMPGNAPPDYEDISLNETESSSPEPTYHGPPPKYPSNEQMGLGYHNVNGGSPVSDESSAASSLRSSRGVGGVPQLPSLRIGRLPEIFIESSTATPASARP